MNNGASIMKPSLPLSVFAGAAHDASGREAAFTPADIDLDAGSDAQARKDAGALRREVDEALEVFRSSGVNLVRVNLDARRLCDAKGNVVRARKRACRHRHDACPMPGFLRFEH
jgi:hypothetical protein